jgi:hypothetical protein
MKKIFGGDSIWAVVRINNLQYAATTATHSFLLVKRFPKKQACRAVHQVCRESTRGAEACILVPEEESLELLRPVDAKTTDIVPE